MADFKPAHGFCAMICEALDATSVGLPISVQDLTLLEADIPVGCYTRLIIQCGGFREIVRFNGDGTIVREYEKPTVHPARAWPEGCQVFFDWTSANMTDWMACIAEEASSENADNEPAKLPGYDTVYDEEEGKWCYVEIDPTPEGESPFEWTSCGWCYYVVGGEIKRKPDPNAPVDGVYKNATVTVSKGKVSFAKGCPVIYKSNCTGCEKCETDETAEP